MASKAMTKEELIELAETTIELFSLLETIEKLDNIDYPKTQKRIFSKIKATVDMHYSKRLESISKACGMIVHDISIELEKLEGKQWMI